jgi:hypothetical protein
VPIDDDGHLHAVADPLSAGEEGAKRAAQRALVGASALASHGPTRGVDREDAADEVAPESDVQVVAHVRAEVDEGARPARPCIENGLDLRVLGRRSRRRRRLGHTRLLVRVGGIAHPVLHRADRYVGGRRERIDVEGFVLGAQIEHEAAESVGVVLAHRAGRHRAWMPHDVREHRLRHVARLARRRNGLVLRRTPWRTHEARQQRLHARRQLVGAAPGRARRLQNRVDRRSLELVPLGEGARHDQDGGDRDAGQGRGDGDQDPPVVSRP